MNIQTARLVYSRSRLIRWPVACNAGVVLARDVLSGRAIPLPDDPKGTGVMVVCETPDEDTAGEALKELGAGRPAQVQQWLTYCSAVYSNVAAIRARYEAVVADYKQAEGGILPYVNQTVVDDREKRTQRLFDKDGPDGRLLPAGSRSESESLSLIGAGLSTDWRVWGGGKTRFCMRYLERFLGRGEQWEATPLLFDLSDLNAGALESFVVQRLGEDYGLVLSFEGFGASVIAVSFCLSLMPSIR